MQYKSHKQGSHSTAIRFVGSGQFRQRLVASLLSSRSIRIDQIRIKDDTTPGLQDFEANFLRLVEQLTDGCQIEINETGTSLRFKPGLLKLPAGVRRIEHDCGVSRSIGWFIEGILPIALFANGGGTAGGLQLTLRGITHDNLDITVDTLQSVTFPLLQNFGIWGIQCKVKRRGAAPKGGGIVELSIPSVKHMLKSVHATEEGLVKRVRGTVFCAKISPAVAARVVDSCRAVLNRVLPDVHISVDAYRGKEGGDSPGYSVSLVAESTTGALLSVERTALTRLQQEQQQSLSWLHSSSSSGSSGSGRSTNTTTGAAAAGGAVVVGEGSSSRGELPEDVGAEAAHMLLRETFAGGVIDQVHQPLVLMLMALTPEDVSKVRFGRLTPQSVLTLQLLRQVFGVTFKLKSDITTVSYTAATPVTATAVGKSGSNSDDNSDDNSDGSSDDSDDSNSDNNSDDINDEETVPRKKARRAKTTTPSHLLPTPQQQQYERETVLVSCYGIGYCNVYRKVT